MPTPDIPLTTALPSFGDPQALLHSIQSVLKSRVLTNRGPVVLEFEGEIRKFLKSPGLSAVTVSNATVGAELVWKALQLKGKVLVTPFTFVATVHAIVNAGLEPVFVDIDPETLCLSPSEVEKHLAPDVVAVCPVHVYGNICDVDYFESLRARGIRVVYDSAHAFGVRLNDRAIGSFGDAEIFSFHATKILNACEGGAVVTRDADLARKISLMTNFGFTGETSIELVGTNAKMSEIHAVFGLASLAELPQAIETRNRLAAHYRRLLSDLPEVETLRMRSGIDGNGQYFPVFFSSKDEREKAYTFLKTRNIFARKYFHPLVNHFAPYLKQYGSTHLPVAESAADRVLCLPIHTLMNERHVEWVVSALQACLR